MRPLREAGPPRSAAVIALSILVAALSRPDHVATLSIVLGIAAVIAGLIVGDGTGGAPMVSSSFIVFSLAATFLGPVSGALAAIISELCSTIRQRTKLRTALLINMPACVVPAVVEGRVIRGLFDNPTNTAAFYIAVTLATMIRYFDSFAMFALLRAVNKPDAERIQLKVLLDSLPSAALSIALTIAGVAITLVVGDAGIA